MSAHPGYNNLAMSFAGLKVVAFESRRAAEIAQLIPKQQGEPIVAPSMREAPIKRNEEVFSFAGRLFSGEFDMMILFTGVGTRILNQRRPISGLATSRSSEFVPDRRPSTQSRGVE